MQSNLERKLDRLIIILNNKSFSLIIFSIFSFSFFLSLPIADPDLFARLAVGQLIQNNHWEIPRVDPFAYTPKNPLWFDHEWLSGVIFFKIQYLFGDFSLVLLKYFIAILTIYLLNNARIQESKNNNSTFIFLFFCIINLMVIWKTTIRAQIFTYFFLALFLHSLSCYKNKNSIKELFLLPIAMILWANLHGGFVVGLGFFGIFYLIDLFSQKKSIIFLQLFFSY